MIDPAVIMYASPLFVILIIGEFLYGKARNTNTYRLNDTFMSISLGVISRFPYLLNLGLAAYTYSVVTQRYSINISFLDEQFVWIISFIFYDFLYYWSHRARHRINILWAAHSVHHHGEEFNLSTALRQTSSGFLITWIFFIPAFMAGIPPHVFATVAAFNLIYQFWVHTEHVAKLGFLEFFMVTPSNHRVHHAKNKEYLDSNYGGVFILWDRIFGTFVEEKTEIRVVYGTVIPLRSWNPFWANISGYVSLVINFLRAENFRAKVWVLFCPPAPCPETPIVKYSSHISLSTDVCKFDPPMGVFQKLDLWVQLFFVLLSSASIAYELGDIDKTEMFVLCGGIIYSTFVSSLAAVNNQSAFLIANTLRVGLIFGIYLFLNPNLLITQIYILFVGVSIFCMCIWAAILKYSRLKAC
ncbi:MAG: hypothetical protein CMM25_09560 [Rhodospirillaceae bacterium]|nr:hypothetical protein [Rhodospirillaceae bacterium]